MQVLTKCQTLCDIKQIDVKDKTKQNGKDITFIHESLEHCQIMLIFAAMFEWFQHTKYCIILLALFCGLNAHAQDDDDIARSINLTEVVVLADGMTFEEYLS